MYQFVHVEAYSRQAPKTAQHKNKKTGKASSKAGGHCVSYIVKEAIRDADSIPHIDNPMPPNYVYGEPLERLESTCEAWAETVTDARGHKLRKDALCLAAGIVSAPHDITPEAWEAFKTDAVDWLKAKYGAGLRSVIEHLDESHPHLHFYAVPEHGQRFETIHQGKAAASIAKGEGGLKGEQNQAYKQAMREFQDEFYDEVGIKHGFTRIGPGKRRLTREEWKLEQIQAAAAAKAIAAAEVAVSSSRIEAEAIKARAIQDAKKVSALAIKNADKIEREAESRGFDQGIKDTEKLSWWRRAKLFIGGAVRERDELRQKLETTEVERDTWRGKARKFFSAGKKVDAELKKIKPELERVENELLVTRRQAREAARLREENEALGRDLSVARDRLKASKATEEALLERLEAQKPEVEQAPQQQRKKHENTLER